MSEPQPASGSAVRPAAAATLEIKVAFIDSTPDLDINCNLARVIQAVRSAIAGGAVIINVTFRISRSQDAPILPELTSVFDAEWKSGVVQPAYSLKFN